MIVTNVFPSQTESYADNEVQKFKLKKDPHPRPTLPPTVSVSTPQLHDREMHDIVARLSPKSSMQKSMHKASISPITPDKRTTKHEIPEASVGPLVPDFFKSSPKPHAGAVESEKKFKYEPAFRNSFGRSKKHDLDTTPAVTLQTSIAEVTAAEDKGPVVSRDSAVHAPIQEPVFSEDTEDEKLTEVVEEDTTDEATSNYDSEVLEAKLRLMLRL